MKTQHKILNRHAFSSDPDPAKPAQVMAEKLASLIAKVEADSRKASARLDALEARFKDPQAQAQAGLRAGIRSGNGTEESMRQDNDRLKKQLSRPAFAAAFFVAQRHTYTARKRQFCGLPQRKLA